MVDTTTGSQVGENASESVLDSAFLTIVSGLPRSGTSMMMQMLKEGGLPVFADGTREADTDNPRGYFEFEPAKKTQEDASWLENSAGKAVKMVYKLLYDLPSDYRYRVLFMRRRAAEVLASQKKMLERQGMKSDVPDEVMSIIFSKELEAVQQWLAKQDNFSVLDVSYNRIIEQPKEEVVKINDFLGPMDMDAMCQVVDPTMYRNRGTE